MRRGTLIAATLTVGTLVFLYTQRKPNAAASGESDAVNKIDPGGSQRVFTPAAQAELAERRARRAADTRVRLRQGYDTLIQQAAENPDAIDPVLFENTASDLALYDFPNEAGVLRQIIARLSSPNEVVVRPSENPIL